MAFACHLYRTTRQHRAGHSQALTYLFFRQARFTLTQIHTCVMCALTAHFHPYPAREQGGYFLWHYLFLFCSESIGAEQNLPVRKRLALCRPDFPPPHACGSDRTACIKCKFKYLPTKAICLVASGAYDIITFMKKISLLRHNHIYSPMVRHIFLRAGECCNIQ
jgi:hypothetical protein